ncbi:hypothetical protein [Streptomyces sp. NPDC096152]|uniref:hypothetical protein n=1 Tax=Streptomyces sp. NPDC096152 TaxID=3366078 RepID=UPI0038140BC4
MGHLPATLVPSVLDVLGPEAAALPVSDDVAKLTGRPARPSPSASGCRRTPTASEPHHTLEGAATVRAARALQRRPGRRSAHRE